ncbi:MAG: HEAT repeat domain-containing protein [Nitrospirota bacterium]
MKNSKDLICHIHALGRYGDLRAVHRLIPLLKSEDNETRKAVISALSVLLTPSSLEALHDHADRTGNPEEAKMCKTIVEKEFGSNLE